MRVAQKHYAMAPPYLPQQWLPPGRKEKPGYWGAQHSLFSHRALHRGPEPASPSAPNSHSSVSPRLDIEGGAPSPTSPC